MTITDYANALGDVRASLRAAQRTQAIARTRYAEATTAADVAAVAQTTLQGIAAAVKATAHRQVAGIVARCLAAVFAEPYQFQIHFEQKRGRTEASLVFLRGGHEVDPLSSAGGGVVDVCAFALRLASLVLSRPRRRRLLVLDEPFKHLSKDYRPAVRQLILALAADLDVQFIIVTHDPVLEVGTVVELS